MIVVAGNQQRAFAIALCHGFKVASIEGDSHGQAGRLVQRRGRDESLRYARFAPLLRFGVTWHHCDRADLIDNRAVGLHALTDEVWIIV